MVRTLTITTITITTTRVESNLKGYNPFLHHFVGFNQELIKQYYKCFSCCTTTVKLVHKQAPTVRVNERQAQTIWQQD